MVNPILSRRAASVLLPLYIPAHGRCGDAPWQKVQNCREWFHQIVRNVFLYIEQQVGNIQPFLSQTIRLRSITLRNSRILPFQGCCSRASKKAGVISVTGRTNRAEKSFTKALPEYVHRRPFTQGRQMYWNTESL